MPAEVKLVTVYTGTYLEAQVMKSHLESEGIPALLRYEGAGLIYGITVDGLGETSVLVPADLSQEAREILRGGEELTD
ncbi:MAG: DUF2007 domain-containing protein [Chloroflexi bacterium]|nr:DUF2007 domain-containing protein [Chloroflexota bacterium]